jgi:hypothetical protein
MSFGRNPHVPKAQAAEQKAVDALDRPAREQAYREAGRQWERAAERENPGKKRTEYEQNAERNRALADAGDEALEAPAREEAVTTTVDATAGGAAVQRNTRVLN